MALHHLGETPLPPLRVTVDGKVVARDAVIVTVANVETLRALAQPDGGRVAHRRAARRVRHAPSAPA
jgi:hypothetical protein